jgi:predicted nuclease of predicted toxin-antitoxin system
MKILLDMNMSPQWIDVLINKGISAVHWSNVGSSNASDAEIMNFAKENHFIVFTHDLDFGAILSITKGQKPSVVQLQINDVYPEIDSDYLVSALNAVKEELEEGALLIIDAKRTRIRVLPLKNA